MVTDRMTTPAPRPVDGSAVLLSGALLAVLVLHLGPGDSTWWSESVVVWPSVGWVVLCLPRVVAWMARRRWMSAGLVLGAAFLLLAATAEWPSVLRAVVPGSGGLPSGPGFRVVSWNVAGEQPFDELSTDAPDIALVQEAPMGPLGPLPPGLKEHHWIGSFDPGALSRFPIESLPSEAVGPWQPPQVLRVSVHGRNVVVVNVRLMLPAAVIALAAFEKPRDVARLHHERIGQFVKLRSTIERALRTEQTPSAILCGDFNSPGSMRSSDALRPLLRDVFLDAGSGFGHTMPAWLPLSRIDQCWVTSDIAVRGVKVARGRSDHRRLVVDLAFRTGT